MDETRPRYLAGHTHTPNVHYTNERSSKSIKSSYGRVNNQQGATAYQKFGTWTEFSSRHQKRLAPKTS